MQIKLNALKKDGKGKLLKNNIINLVLGLVGRKTAVKPVGKRNKILEGFTLRFISKGLNSDPILKNLTLEIVGNALWMQFMLDTIKFWLIYLC